MNLKTDEFWDKVLGYSDYKKGKTYSASDINNEPLRVKLKLLHPNVDDVNIIDKMASWMGSSVHATIEIIMQSYDNVESELKVAFKSVSGTIDLVFDKRLIGDVKTGSEASISQKIKKPIKWVEQLSIYRLLYFKQFGIWLEDTGYIFWLTTDTKKRGVEEIELLSKEETITLIKDFLNQIEKPLSEQPKCKDCSWLYRYCPTRSKCPYMSEDKNPNFKEVEEW